MRVILAQHDGVGGPAGLERHASQLNGHRINRKPRPLARGRRFSKIVGMRTRRAFPSAFDFFFGFPPGSRSRAGTRR